jgi:hypothetical protein
MRCAALTFLLVALPCAPAFGGSGLAKNVPVSTWHRSVRGSMPSSLQDAISEYIAAARSPPLLDLAKSGAARAIKLN